ncbi:MAG: hypothetical protein J7647_00730 [Cyanobacteria bacterium SBLK]|nr:hypothetical protein [Cyanobacteria bacterium SBLK]
MKVIAKFCIIAFLVIFNFATAIAPSFASNISCSSENCTITDDKYKITIPRNSNLDGSISQNCYNNDYCTLVIGDCQVSTSKGKQPIISQNCGKVTISKSGQS